MSSPTPRSWANVLRNRRTTVAFTPVVRRRPRWSGTGVGLISVAVALIAWEIVGRLTPNSQFLFSYPTSILVAGWHLVINGVLPMAFLESAREMLIGLALATILGLSVGFAMGRFVVAGLTLQPLVALAIASPTIGLLPLFEIWFGFGVFARIMFITAVSVWGILLNTFTGVREVSSRYEDLARASALDNKATALKIVLPAATPYIFVGLRLGIAHAMVGMVLAGQTFGLTGLGGLTNTYSTESEISDVVAVIFAITLLAYLAFWALRAVELRFFPWIAETGRADQ
jgi:ABC-type nitrate/sulfonate/bicarbonate transport system permease component